MYASSVNKRDKFFSDISLVTNSFYVARDVFLRPVSKESYNRIQKLSKIIFERMQHAPTIIAPYGRILVDHVPVDSNMALLELSKNYFEDEMERQNFISGVKSGFSENFIPNNHSAAFIVGFCLGKSFYFSENQESTGNNKFRISTEDDKVLENLNQILDQDHILTKKQIGGFTGWFVALSRKLKTNLIFPKLVGLTPQVKALLDNIPSNSEVKEYSNGQVKDDLTLSTESLPFNIPLNIKKSKIDESYHQMLTNIFNDVGEEVDTTQFKVNSNPTITFGKNGARSDYSLIRDHRFLKNSIITPIGEKLNTDEWKNFFDEFINQDERKFVFGSWSGKISIQTLLASARKNTKGPLYLASFNSTELKEIIHKLTNCKEDNEFIEFYNSWDVQRQRHFDFLLSKLGDVRESYQKETSTENSDIKKNHELKEMTLGVDIVRSVLGADYVSCRTNDFEITSYNEQRMPFKRLFRFHSIVASYIARYLVNLKLQSTDESGLPEADLVFDNANFEELNKNVKDDKINFQNFCKELNRNRFILPKLLKLGIAPIGLDSTLSFTPIPRSIEINSPEIGIGDLSDWVKANLLNLLLSRK